MIYVIGFIFYKTENMSHCFYITFLNLIEGKCTERRREREGEREIKKDREFEKSEKDGKRERNRGR